jgi:CheY-like chemotaxis protein
VLTNLLTNAIKFTPPGGQIWIELQPEAAGQVAVSVSDTGMGISPAVLPHLFEAFMQADRSLDRNPGGLGLGLVLVKGLVELHGGEVRAASAGLGRGATFTFLLPPLQAEFPRTCDVPAILTPVPLRVLVIEDNQDAAETLRDLLELAGSTVETAYSGTAGIEVARRFRPEVVLCDIGLPGLDGYQVAAALRRDPATAGARLIAVTGYGAEEDRQRSRAAGFECHLVKPLDPHEVQRLLGTGSQQP